MLSENDKAVLEQIVEADGRCMNSKRCLTCPFRSQCLPEFFNPNPPTQNQRVRMAFDVLAHNSLFDDSMSVQEFKDKFSRHR